MKSVRGKKKKTAKRGPRAAGVKVIRPHVAGIDLGSRQHWVACPTVEEGKPNVRVFGTTTPELNELADWLHEQAIESVAMESTSVYWIPLYELLESRGIDVLLVNARQLSHVPGRKSDMLDCQWLQLLHSCGLLRGSFRPAESICRLRALLRERGNLTQERTRAVQRMQKALDQMNVQVHRALADITGQTGMRIVRAIVAGERDPKQLAAHRDPRCRKSAAEIANYLTGNWRQEHLFNLHMTLQLYDEVERILAAYDEEIMGCLVELQPPERVQMHPGPHPSPAKEKALKSRGEQPLRTALWRVTGVDLTRIDGIAPGAAQVVVSEVGLDLHSFPTENHFASWLRLAPRVPISGGKPLPKKNKGTGATRVAGVLRMAALSLKNSHTALGAYFRRLARRKDASVAIFATARKLAILIYRMLKYGQDYVDEGAQAYQERFRQRRLRSLTTIAKSMGYKLVPVDAST